MPVIFYQSNFCAECGNRLDNASTPRRWWQHRYFCPNCAIRLGYRWDWLPIGFAILGLMMGFVYNLSRKPVVINSTPVTPASLNSLGAPSSILESTTQLKPLPASTPIAMYFCGARTLKGTPCKHKVAASDLRCFQHQGKPAMKR